MTWELTEYTPLDGELGEYDERTDEPMNDLEKLIADSIAARDAKIAEAEAVRKAEDAKYEAIFNEVVNDTIERAKAEIPAPLHQYIKYTNGQPSNDSLEARTWIPTMLVIDAPGLAEILITVNIDRESVVHVYGITSGEHFESTEWPEAICAAHDRYHNQRAEYSRAARELG
jgi:hypothetical protein